MAILNLTYGSGTYLRVIEYDYDDVAHQVTNGSISGTVIPSGVGPDVEVHRQDGVDGEYWSVRSQNAAPYAYVVYVGAPLVITDIDKVDAMNGNLGSVIGTGSGNGTKRWTLYPFAGPQVSNIFADVPPGNYTLILSRLEDGDTDSIPITIEDIPDLQAAVTGSNCTAFGADDGQITVSGLVGSGDYTLTFVTEDVVVNIDGSVPYVRTNLTPRGYLIVILDNLTGQSENFLVTITEPAYVCHLFFFEAGSFASSASGLSVADGAIHASAMDGDGLTIKFNLNADFDYYTQGQLSGTFNGLVPGTYTVYARSNESCLKTMQFVVGYDVTYNPLYRTQFYDDRGSFHYRFDIEDNEFVGAVTELENFGPEPVKLSWRGEEQEDIDTAVISSELELQLITDEEGQFDGLLDGDERRFRGSLYVEIGGDWILKWQGYLVPQLFSEGYIQKVGNYNSFVFTDQLANLSTIPFSDPSGNSPVNRLSVFDVIRYCLSKTDIALEIWDTFNIAHAEMNDNAEDCSLEQIFVDPTIYLSESGETMSDCLTVLKSELSNIFCRLVQSDGHWQIDHIPFKAGADTLTRRHTFQGGSISVADEQYRVMLRRGVMPGPRIAVANRDQLRTVTKPGGKLSLDFDLGLEQKNNILSVDGFQDEDISNGQLKGWQIKAGSSSVFGIDFNPSIVKVLRDGALKDVLKVDFLQEGIGVALRECSLSADTVKLESSDDPYTLELTFDVMVNGYESDAFIFFDYRINFEHASDNYYLSPIIQSHVRNDIDGFFLSDDGVPGYIRKYIQPGDWQTITIRVDSINNLPLDVDGIFNLNLHFFANQPFDVDGFDALTAIPTVSGSSRTVDYNAPSEFPLLNFANKIRCHDTIGGIDVIRQYSLHQGTDATDSPNVFRPDDYGTQPIKHVWKLDETIIPDNQGTEPHVTPWLQSILIDNVQVKYLPNGRDPNPTISYELILNPNNKLILTRQYRHGDILGDNSDNDSNFQYITKGQYMFTDGTPTYGAWRYYTMGGVEPHPEKPILQHMLDWFQGHNSVNRIKLSGTYDHDGIIPSMINTIYEVRSGLIYLPMSMSLLLRSRLFQSELIDILRGEPSDDEGDPDPGVDPPVNIREHTDEFTAEFY